MIHAEEVRIGNRFFWKPKLPHTNVLIQVEITAVLQDKAGYVRSHFEHRVEPFEDDVVTKEIPYASFEELVPVRLADVLLKFDIEIKYPTWIQYLHELQNWYYWENGKKELQIDE